MQLSDAGALFEGVHDHARGSEDRGVELLLVGTVRADGGDEGPGSDVVPGEEGSLRGSAGDDDVARPRGRTGIASRLDRNPELARHPLGEGSRRLEVQVEGSRPFDRPDAAEGFELDASLVSAAEDR